MRVRLVAGAVACSCVVACSSPSVPSPSAPAANTTAIAVSNVAATVDKTSTGAVYHVWFQLKETGGQNGATLSTVLFTLRSGAAALTATYTPTPTRRIAAGGSLALGPINVSDDAGASTPIATEISVAVNFTDDGGRSGSAIGTASVTPPVPLTTYTVSGVITDGTSGPSGRMRGVIVKVLNGANAGLSTATDSEGTYALTGIAAGSCTLSASIDGYQTKTADVSISADTRVDFVLPPIADPPHPGPPAGPGPTPLPLVNLGGTWSGTSSDATVFTWALTQSGNSVSGTVRTQSVNPSDGSCNSCHRNKSGTFSGTISGTTLSMTMSFPAGVPGDPTPICSQTLTGDASSFSTNALTAGYSGSDHCEGALSGGVVMTR